MKNLPVEEVTLARMAKLADVNTTDIRDGIRLGCQTMSRTFNAEDNDVPYQRNLVFDDARFVWVPRGDSHVPGRHLNALLRAEAVADITIDENAIEKHKHAAFFSYSGPVRLPLAREKRDGDLHALFAHDIREGLHALYGLTRFRQCGKAEQLISETIEAVFEHWDETHGWDVEQFEDKLGLRYQPKPFINELARAIGPLVKIFETIGLERALELAIVLKEKAIRELFKDDGHHDKEAFYGHTHSITSTLSGLAQLAELTSDGELFQRVEAFYTHGLWDFRDEIGWAIENVFNDRDTDRGEGNTTGDIIETALILGRRGTTKYYEDAERMLRCHLLPSQLRDVSFISELPNPKDTDELRDVANRLQGSFGFPAPWGHIHLGSRQKGFHGDIVGGVVDSLCAAHEEVARTDASGHWVNLHFDHKTNDIEIESPYTHEYLAVRVKNSKPLFVRIPSWMNRDSIQIDDASVTPRFSNDYLFLSRPPADRWIQIQFILPERELKLQHQTREIRTRLRGDEVIAMENFGADLTFFDAL